MRVMLDTNILVSMIFFPSNVTRTFARNLSKNHQIILCDYVIKELQLVVKRKFPNKVSTLDQFFRDLPFQLVYTTPVSESDTFPHIRDNKDFPILTTTLLENIDYFITGDKDFLVLNLKKPKIMTMSEFNSLYT